MAIWKRLPQENEGQDFWFQGRCLLTHGVSTNLSPEEVQAILADLHEFVKEKQGVDYLQVYEREGGLRVWIIDQVPKSELDDHPLSHNHYTILFPEEY